MNAIPDTLADGFRAAMRQLASTVTLLTAGEGEARRGLTATAVCSLSVTPPSMLICVNRFGEAHEAMTKAGHFCVNILADDQRDLALRFAGQGGSAGAEKFSEAAWSSLSTGAPALDGALVNLDCEIASASPTESHTIFIGHVKAIRFGDSRSPLLHFDRDFWSLANQTAL